MPRARPRPATRRGRAGGQALVELALILPVFLIILGAAVDLGRLFQAYVTIENAAKEGAFFGIQSPRCDVAKAGCADPNTVDWHVRTEAASVPIRTLVVQCLAGGVGGTPSSVDGCVEGDGYRVAVTTRFMLLTPLLSPILGDHLDLTATAVSPVFNKAFDPDATPFPIPSPTPTPTATATPTPTPTATPTPTPTGTPACATVPNLSGLTVSAARAQWDSLFSGGFSPNGQNNKTVTGQTTIPASAPGNCIVSTASVTVTYR